ncbi:hypothetical protein [Streptomyces sp. NPDC048385]|uniref:hypothetical protein n=1 Tax=unclassified Streptomyces TaxID=2593676 RepID=UPI00343FF0B3
MNDEHRHLSNETLQHERPTALDDDGSTPELRARSEALREDHQAGTLPPRMDTGDADRQLSRDEEIRGVQGWMAMDLHRALGLSVDDHSKYQGHASWADWWANLMAQINQRTRAIQAYAQAQRTDLEVTSDFSVIAATYGADPTPVELFFPFAYGITIAAAHPAAPHETPYMIDLVGVSDANPLQEETRRLITHRSLVSGLVRDIAALNQPGQQQEQPAPVGWEALARQREAELKKLGEQKHAVEQERDGAYRERNTLVALLAGYTDGAVVAPAPDVDEPGWRIVYLQLDGRQASWHFGPRDADLTKPLEHVAVDDPRAQWDGHTTEAKYAHITALTAELLQRCGPACAEQHTETGRCELARNR